jgi:hypothetical protein
LEIVLNLIYVATTKFKNERYAKACVTFIILQPVWYLFIYFLYMVQTEDTVKSEHRCKRIFFAPIYAVLQQFKLLSGIEILHKKFSIETHFDEKYPLMTLEGCFKV